LIGRPRVLYVTKYTGGGAAISLYRLLTGLDRDRYEPLVLCLRVLHPEFVAQVQALGVEVLTLATGGDRSPGAELATGEGFRRWVPGLVHRFRWLYPHLRVGYRFCRSELAQARTIARAVRRIGPAMVHSNAGLPSSRPVIVASWLAGVPCLCHVRNFDPLTWLDRRLAHRVDRFIFISRAVLEGYVAQGLVATGGEVIPNAVGPEAFSSPPEAQAIRRELGWSDRDFIVVNVGRLVRWKGQDVFLQAMAQVADVVPHWRCFIVGEPDGDAESLAFAEELRTLAQDLGLAERVTFTGFRDDVLRLMKASDVVVHSASTPEPFGRVIIEGMAAGKPVVATRGGGVVDIVEHGRDGLLVPLGDPRAMAEAVLAVQADPIWAGRLGARAQEKVRRQFTLDRHVERVQQVYQRILGWTADHAPAYAGRVQSAGGGVPWR
jgi:glycosyltransferase involved in cell wall biosynthesis